MSNLPSQKDAIAQVLELYSARPFVVADIGSQSAWLKAASHDARNLYVSGPMGLASSIALGVAVCRPNERVLAICGDGALAMNLSSLATIAGSGVTNLDVLVIDNGIYEYTASVPVPTKTLDWEALGRAIFEDGSTFALDGLDATAWNAAPGPRMVVAKVAPSSEPAPGTGLSPAQIRASFLAASKL